MNQVNLASIRRPVLALLTQRPDDVTRLPFDEASNVTRLPFDVTRLPFDEHTYLRLLAFATGRTGKTITAAFAVAL